METYNLMQGTDAWHKFRFEHFGASEAAAMLGVSKKTTRTELLDIKHTGNPKTFSEWVQKNILDYGHEVEALARPIVERIIGDDLYPVTCAQGMLSASVDGLTMDGTTAFEHKQWNEQSAASVREKIVPEEHYPQCQQILLVTGADRVIFCVSDGTEEKMVWMEVFPDTAFFAHIEAGWNQFEMDLATYVPVVHAEKPQATAIMQLPTLSIALRGEVLTSNLPVFTQAATQFIANIKTDLRTDADFADAEETIKFCGRVETELKVGKKAAIEQTVDVAELMRTIDYVEEQMRSKRLELEKLVKAKKESIKNEIVADARLKFAKHVSDIDDEIHPLRLVFQQPDFQGAIKNKRTITSLHDAVDLTLANSKIATDAIAKDVRAKLAWHKANAEGFNQLFPDLDRIIYKAVDDFQMVVQNRIEQHKLDLKKKLDDEQEKIRQENERKAAINQAQAAKTEIVAPAKEAARPTLIRTEAQPDKNMALMLELARRDAEAFMNKYREIGGLALVMKEIEAFLLATSQPERMEAYK